MTSMDLEVPSGGEATSVKQKIMQIPLFRRSRKKSNQSSSSGPFTSSYTRDSADLGELPKTSRIASTDTRCVGLFSASSPFWDEYWSLMFKAL